MSGKQYKVSGNTQSVSLASTTTNERNNSGQPIALNCKETKLDDDNEHNNFNLVDANDGRTLLVSSRELVDQKNFGSEVRAAMDIEEFVHQGKVALDISQTSAGDIVDALLEKILDSDALIGNQLTTNKLSNLLFVNGESTLMAKTVQAICSQRRSHHLQQHHHQQNIQNKSLSTNSDIIVDQSWLIAMCRTSQVKKRCAIIGRLKNCVDFGDGARRVRLLALIVAPSEEKLTKIALEYARTLATLLADQSFRSLLLTASNEVEFKALMLNQLDKLLASASGSVKFKNRHSHKLDSSIQRTAMLFSAAEMAKQKLAKLNKEGENKSALAIKLELDQSRVSSSQLNLTCPSNESLFRTSSRSSKILEIISWQTSEQFQGQQQPTTVDSNKCKLSAPSLNCCYLPSSLCGDLRIGADLLDDFKRRLKHYPSDFVDGFRGPDTIRKVFATTVFLYFSILLPTIAFSSLNARQTNGQMGDLLKAIIGQAFGGLFFALFSGQPLVIIMTTAPLCLYTKVIYHMSVDNGFEFYSMYAAVGLWNAIFMAIYSFLGVSESLIEKCSRFVQEVFALFIVCALISDAGSDMMKNFHMHYLSEVCKNQSIAAINATMIEARHSMPMQDSNGVDLTCNRETSLLFSLLMLGTAWLGLKLYNFNKTSYFDAVAREIISAYALPIAIVAMTFVGSYVFVEVKDTDTKPLDTKLEFERARIELLSVSGIFLAMGLGFALSLLFLMDQNISAAMVNTPKNKLKKGSAYHFDLLIVGLLNTFLTFFGFPMMHGVLPHSPMHARCLADIDEVVVDGHRTKTISNIRETRVTGVVSHIFIFASLYLMPYPIGYIPTAVLNGLFIYMAVTSLDDLQIFYRIKLIFTEQTKYPPNNYVRRCPQSKIHLFTLFQIFLLVVLCCFGFSPINMLKMFFPVLILLMIPFRQMVVTKFITEHQLDALDEG